MNEFSSGIIVFRQTSKERLYLLLHYSFKGDYWDFPRGNVREGETAKDAASREIEEETGILQEDLRFIEGFQENVGWMYSSRGEYIHKKVIYFLAETRTEQIRISDEHSGFKWLRFDDALRLLKYINSKNILSKAEILLRKLDEQNSVEDERH